MGAQDEQTKLADLPSSIKHRHAVVNLTEGGTFTVERLALPKLLYILSWLSGVIKDIQLTSLDPVKLAAMNPMELGVQLVQTLGDKLPDFIGLAVKPEDKELVLTLPADDQLDILVEIIKLNWSEKLVKKAKELFGLFRSRWQANSKPT